MVQIVRRNVTLRSYRLDAVLAMDVFFSATDVISMEHPFRRGTGHGRGPVAFRNPYI